MRSPKDFPVLQPTKCASVPLGSFHRPNPLLQGDKACPEPVEGLAKFATPHFSRHRANFAQLPPVTVNICEDSKNAKHCQNCQLPYRNPFPRGAFFAPALRFTKTLEERAVVQELCEPQSGPPPRRLCNFDTAFTGFAAILFSFGGGADTQCSNAGGRQDKLFI